MIIGIIIEYDRWSLITDHDNETGHDKNDEKDINDDKNHSKEK